MRSWSCNIQSRRIHRLGPGLINYQCRAYPVGTHYRRTLLTRKPSQRQVSARQPSHRRLTPPRWGTPCNVNAIYRSLKSTFSGLQFRRWQYGYIFIRLAVISSEIREMSRNSKRLTLQQFKVIQGHRSWCQWKAHMWLPNVIVNLAISATVFEIFTLKDRSCIVSHIENLVRM